MGEGSISESVSLRAARRRRQIADRRRDAVVAATAVFAAKGYHDAQMAEIGAAAEMSLASLYSLFAGKEALYQEVMRHAADRMHREVRLKVEEQVDPVARLFAFIDALFDCFEKNRPVLRLVLAGTHGIPRRIRRSMGKASDELLDGFYAWVERLCSDAVRARALDQVDAGALTAALVGGMTILASTLLERRPESRLTDLAPAMRSLFERLVAGATP